MRKNLISNPIEDHAVPEDESIDAYVEPTFESDLQKLLNRYSAESPSGTPDFILAYFLQSVLRDYNEAVSWRADWRRESIELPALTRLNSEGVVAIVARSQTLGKQYAQELGIENWLVITDPRKAEGLRTRAIIITPGYFEFVLDGMFNRLRTLDDLRRSTQILQNPLG